MARELGHGGNVGPGVEQIADEGAPQIMRREVRHAGLRGPLAQQVIDALGGQAAGPQLAGIQNRPEERAGVGAAKPSQSASAASVPPRT